MFGISSKLLASARTRYFPLNFILTVYSLPLRMLSIFCPGFFIPVDIMNKCRYLSSSLGLSLSSKDTIRSNDDDRLWTARDEWVWETRTMLVFLSYHALAVLTDVLWFVSLPAVLEYWQCRTPKTNPPYWLFFFFVTCEYKSSTLA